MKKIWLIVWLLPYLVSAQKNKALPDYLQLQKPIFAMSMVMMHDVVNPPAASRFYSYAMLGAYEIASQHKAQMVPLQKLIKAYKPIKIISPKPYDYRIAAVYSVFEIGKRLLPSGFMLQEAQDQYIVTLRKHQINQSQIEAAVSVANQLAAHIVQYANTDGYKNLSAKLRYTPIKGEGYWYPTPPAYIEAVEPNWRIIRPMLIDSFNQFPPLPPISFSKDSNSVFYKMAKEVYAISKSLTNEQLHIASFWDCNPFVVNTSGHMSIGFKKISPGGHWMNIAGIATKQAKLNFDDAVLVHTMVSLTLVDAFISCWDEKYRSNRIRPETYINKYIDLKWQPLLQTPPFPEYTSGHSVISTAAAEMLSYLLGSQFAYTDDSEDMFDIKARSYKSFRHAAEEAAISRLYGGIHFIDAIVNGQSEGKAVGLKAVDKINQAGIKPILKQKNQSTIIQ
jgi:PAP2 superfamily